jgi:hypothetical protein
MRQIKSNTKRYIHIIALLLLYVGQTKAQVVPIEKMFEYRLANKGIPDGTYLKDVNHLLDPLLGNWQGSIDNKTYVFYITKKTDNSYNILVDELEVRHYIVDNTTGIILEDSRNVGKPCIYPDYHNNFDKNLAYVLYYYGKNSRCGQKGHIRLKSLSPTTMNFYYSWYPFDLRRKEECPEGDYLKALLPENIDLILNKQ